MPALASPVADERSALREYLAYHQSAFFAVAYGLTDEQARSCPTVSELSIGGLIRHAAGMHRTWMARAAETLDGLLETLKAENAKSLHLVETADLDAEVPVPQDIPWFPRGIKSW